MSCCFFSNLHYADQFIKHFICDQLFQKIKVLSQTFCIITYKHGCNFEDLILELTKTVLEKNKLLVLVNHKMKQDGVIVLVYI